MRLRGRGHASGGGNRTLRRRLLRLEGLEGRCLLAGAAHNVILMIGDGMGTAHVDAARMFLGGEIVFDGFPYQAEMTTFSADSPVTDSAASTTAMATGRKVDNGVLSVAVPGDGSDLTTSLEMLCDAGKATGLVTTTTITHATPAAFAAHAASRYDTAKITSDLLTRTRPNVLFGGGGQGMTGPGAVAAGYTVVEDAAGLLALDTGTETFVSGQFGDGHMPYEYDGLGDLPHLAQMTATALDLLDNDPDGFFLLVEGGRIDHAAHANDIERDVRETAEFAQAVQVVFDWAAGRADTMVLVTADHETGGLSVVADNGPGTAPDVTWSTSGHTAVNVPVYAWGAHANLVAGVLDNTDVFALVVDGARRLGPITFRELTDLDPASGPLWFRGETTRRGLLTIEAGLPAAPDTAQLALYDDPASDTPLATSTLLHGKPRIDWPVEAGQTYYVQLSGTGSDVDLRLANLVEVSSDGSQVIVYGTEADDTFEAVSQRPYSVAVNSLQYEFESLSQLQVFGQAGYNQATVRMTDGGEDALVSADSAVVTGPSYRLELNDVAAITLAAGGENARVTFHDSPGSDTLTAWPNAAVMTGAGLHHVATGFARITADAAPGGGRDVAKLYDSSAGDRFVGAWGYGELQGDGYYLQVWNFDAVHAYGSGGHDVAKLFDSPHDDVFFADPTEAAIYSNVSYTRAKNFDAVHAYRVAGGQDVAYLVDSPGNDIFYGHPLESALYGERFFNRAKSFEEVYAYGSGGRDTARMFDSPADDTYFAVPEYAELSGSGFFYRATGFDGAHGYSAVGGHDTAELHDSPGDDILFATGEPDNQHTALYRPGAFYNRAKFFEEVSAYADAGGNDVAYLADSVLDDLLEAEGDWAELKYGGRDDWYVRAQYFDTVHAYSDHGGDDKKDLRPAYEFDLILHGPWNDL